MSRSGLSACSQAEVVRPPPCSERLHSLVAPFPSGGRRLWRAARWPSSSPLFGPVRPPFSAEGLGGPGRPLCQPRGAWWDLSAVKGVVGKRQWFGPASSLQQFFGSHGGPIQQRR